MLRYPILAALTLCSGLSCAGPVAQSVPASESFHATAALHSMLLQTKDGTPRRCDADATPVGNATRRGVARDGLLCTDAGIVADQRALCRSALQAVRQGCDTACGVFEKLNEAEEPSGDACPRDKRSRTSATPGCIQTTFEDRSTATASCIASITCLCDP